MAFVRQSLLLPLALAAALSAAPAGAETTDATLSGIVRERGKAPLTGVTVTATNRRTRASATTTTSAEGGYSMALAPGSYTVKATASGFRGETASVVVPAGGGNQLRSTTIRTAG